MPELPDVTVYVESLERRIVGQPLERVRLISPFVLRTAVPPLSVVDGRRVVAVHRLGKRIVLCLEGGYFLVLHLMIAGRLRWLGRSARPPGRISLALFDFPAGTLVFTEAGTRKRASLHLVQGEAALAAFDLGGVEVSEADLATFAERLQQENHTLKRALTDPRLFSGIGNAYSQALRVTSGTISGSIKASVVNDRTVRMKEMPPRCDTKIPKPALPRSVPTPNRTSSAFSLSS